MPAFRWLLFVAFPLLSFAEAARVPVCTSCHPQETARFAKSAMGNSLIPPASVPPGKVSHEHSQSLLTTSSKDGAMVHTLLERGLSAEYPVRYQIGGGLMGRTYMVQIGDTLFESPVSWFNTYGWDMSPGYKSAAFIDFDRPMEETCLFCHAGAARFSDPDGRRLKDALTPITCERCHGPSEAHVGRPSSQNIINPAKLSGRARDSICEQCHLEGAARVLNSGRSWSDFHAGQPAEDIYATFLLTGTSSEVVAVSQTEELAQSKCARASNGKLWCGTCHQPHGIPASSRAQQIKAVCTTCHATLPASAHPPNVAECTSCHMPRAPTTDISHAALTDHRLLRHPADSAPGTQGQTQKVAAWRDPPADTRTRDLGLAEILIGYSKRLPAIGQDGVDLLQSLPSSQQTQDATVLSDLEGLSLQSGDLQDALQYGRRLTELQPRSAKAALNLGIVLKRSGDSGEAEQQFNRAIELDASLKQAYIELATLYAAEKKSAETLATINRFLKWNGQDIMFRLQKASAGATQP